MSRESFNETISDSREALTHIGEEEPTQLQLHLRKPTNGDCATCARALEIANAQEKARIEQLERTIQRLVTTIKSNVIEVRGCKVVPVMHLFDVVRDAENVVGHEATEKGAQ